MSNRFKLLREFYYWIAFRGDRIVGSLIPTNDTDTAFIATIGSGYCLAEEVPDDYDRVSGSIPRKDGSVFHPIYYKKFSSKQAAERWLRDNT